jgi:hypothetical protein
VGLKATRMTGKECGLTLKKIQGDIFFNIEIRTYWIDLSFAV